MPSIELDRAPIRLPALSDDPNASLPAPLLNARAALLQSGIKTAKDAAAPLNDPRWSEGERQKQLTALFDKTLAEFGGIAETASATEALAAESEAGALRQAVAEFDPARLLAIQTSLATRTREQRMSAVMRARAGDRESAAAILSAPAELSILADIDPRVTDGLIDRLVPAEIRASVAATKFAVVRLRSGLQNTVDVLRLLCRAELPPAARIQRVA